MYQPSAPYYVCDFLHETQKQQICQGRIKKDQREPFPLECFRESPRDEHKVPRYACMVLPLLVNVHTTLSAVCILHLL